MNENENNFEALRRLLAFKNSETPPPGYFDNFSAQVVNRIRAGAKGAPESTSKRLFAEAPWLMKLLQSFEFKPAFAGSFAGALCLLLLFGIVYAERPDSAPQPLLTQSAQSPTPLAMASVAGFQPASVPSGLLATTNPVLDMGSVATLFSQPGQLGQQVSFVVPGN